MEKGIPKNPEISLPLHLQGPFFEGLVTYAQIKTGELQRFQNRAADDLVSGIDAAVNNNLYDTTAHFLAILGVVGRDLKKAPTIDDVLSGTVPLDPVEELPPFDIAEIIAREEQEKRDTDWFLEGFLRRRKELEKGIDNPDEDIDNS